MATRTGGGGSSFVWPVFEDLKPTSEWQHGDESHHLIIHLPGFTNEQIRVSTEGKNIIRVRGERLAGNKWSRFLEDFQVPRDGEITSVRARFGEGRLNIAVPKKCRDKPQENDQEKSSDKESTSDDPGEKQGHAESEGTSISAVPHVASGRADGVIKEDEKGRKVKSTVDDGVGAFTIDRYKKAVKGLTELNEERLMVNIGVGVLVVVALSAYVTYRFASRDDKS
ncbi:hypothetical protein ACS0TY_005731 [Phlomoides rotata]